MACIAVLVVAFCFTVGWLSVGYLFPPDKPSRM